MLLHPRMAELLIVLLNAVLLVLLMVLAAHACTPVHAPALDLDRACITQHGMPR
jgi:hypothetical protein